ncbi:MAG: CpaF family protein, partial [Hyphomonas sp.]|nr:CpaF family protein [Hyphomonas sp.]
MAFGKRSGAAATTLPSAAPAAASAPRPAAPKPAAPVASAQPKPAASVPGAAPAPAVKLKTPEFKPEPVRKVNQHSEQYYTTKTTIFNALINTI